MKHYKLIKKLFNNWSVISYTLAFPTTSLTIQKSLVNIIANGITGLNLQVKEWVYMTPIVQLYWLRVALGLTVGSITAVIAQFVFGSAADYTPLINSITVALLFYFVTYYILKATYKNKVEKQSKILSTGIGIYFFSWLMTFVLVYTIIQVVTGTVA